MEKSGCGNRAGEGHGAISGVLHSGDEEAFSRYDANDLVRGRRLSRSILRSQAIECSKESRPHRIKVLPADVRGDRQSQMNPPVNFAHGRPSLLKRAAKRECLGLLVALTAIASSGPCLAQSPEKPKRNLLFIGQAKGYKHESISTAVATVYNLG